jgi:hypothetical protein
LVEAVCKLPKAEGGGYTNPLIVDRFILIDETKGAWIGPRDVKEATFKAVVERVGKSTHRGLF